jgi:hypothetical protein
MGNNIVQIMNAIMFGQALNVSRLLLPSQEKFRLPIFDLPSEIAISPNAHLRFHCNASGLKHFFGRCTDVNKRMAREALLEHLAPHLTEATKRACEVERAQPFDGLTVHLRSGDAHRISTRQGMLAPCSFFQKIVFDHGFSSVRVVTERDMSHPCLNALSQTLPNVSIQVQSKSIEEDVCALMHARHLAVGSFSTFSQTAELFNTDLKSLFWPVPAGGSMAALGNICVAPESGLNGTRETYTYQIDGMQNALLSAHDLAYIVNTSLQNVSLRSVCDEEQEIPFAGSLR